MTKLSARRGGAEVAGWTLDRKIRVRFPAYPHRMWALWWQGGKRRLWTSRCPCRGRLGTLKTPSCLWRGCPAAGQNLETGHLSRHYIAEISLNVTLNHNQHQSTTKLSELRFKSIFAKSCRLISHHLVLRNKWTYNEIIWLGNILVKLYWGTYRWFDFTGDLLITSTVKHFLFARTLFSRKFAWAHRRENKFLAYNFL